MLLSSMWNLLIDHGNVPERRLDTEQFLVAAGYRRVQRARGGTQRTALRGLAAFEPMDVESCAVGVSVETFSVFVSIAFGSDRWGV